MLLLHYHNTPSITESALATISPTPIFYISDLLFLFLTLGKPLPTEPILEYLRSPFPAANTGEVSVKPYPFEPY